ncbi:SMP-30/gluconolactonase/LRE family protein [Enemella evansiae]|uniref:SMP-30/gluconolactonase/LRE family protein n=1 Tax=Enemella evansiae TaxID=2016499 RepID=UPI000B95FC93|nr:SMP-30/gluconolactonase/LRE family protein [Enemella evansiae]OYO03823.1 gluconolactonase [Enemella evansiae]
MTAPQQSPLLAEDAELTRVATGAIWAEGPVWVPRRRAVRFSDIPNNRILEFSEETGELTVFADDVEFTNGRTLDLDGRVVECSHGRRAVQRDTAVGPGEAYTPEVLVDRFGEHRLNSPNDVVVASDGAIWFSDPAYGIKRAEEGHPGVEEYGDRYVFRFDPATGSLLPVVIDIEAPNGLAFSPDEKLLYVSDSSIEPADRDNPAPDRPRGHAIHVYDVIEGRHAKNGRILTEVSPGLPDGIRVDVDGNIWSSSESGVQVFTPDGERVLDLPVPEKVGNLCFGGEDGRTLYIVATTSLYRVRTRTRDASSGRGPVAR